jgi:5-methylcytosine-specific restriction endonuclease McrA
MPNKNRLPPKEYHALCSLVFERDKWSCQVCKIRQNLQAHHIIYRSQGGKDELDNLLTVCSACHVAIHAMDVIISFKRDAGIFTIILKNGWTPQYKVR